ncbi:hypothetical protein RN001_006330 [Aquatica leii]|uniref:Peptide deformylase n=1 Tax=Aquatica leii TaxID=1421715 RepID=A0AAN7PL11_9COLE|nr:hypothetical protein RN001_006330 [Aquatica leii]
MRHLSYKKIKSWYCGLVQRPPPTPPYSHIIQIGDPLLRTVAQPVAIEEIKSSEIQHIVKKLKAVIKQYGCVGLSAPQIGIALRIILLEFTSKHAKSYTKDEIIHQQIEILPQTVIINPELKVLDYTKVVQTEGCESIKGYIADVARYQQVEVKGVDENGNTVSLNLKGWLARIVQHEMDHLNGKLYTDVMNRKTLTCSCWQVVNEKRGKVEIPFSP